MKLADIVKESTITYIYTQLTWLHEYKISFCNMLVKQLKCLANEAKMQYNECNN